MGDQVGQDLPAGLHQRGCGVLMLGPIVAPQHADHFLDAD